MTIVAADFRTNFPAFANSAIFPDPQITFYLNLGYQMLNACRWGDTLDYGVQLFAAHFLSLDRLTAVQGIGGVPGSVIGIITAGVVDKVQYTRDIESVMEENAGHWGMTSFGLIFIRLARMMGAGPIQVGIGSAYPGQSAYLYGGAWPGPMVGPY